MYHPFCGIQSIRQGPGHYKFMSGKTLDHITQLLAPWDPIRVEMAMHGEPTRHPELETSLACLRQHLPASTFMMTSNGGGFRNKSRRFQTVMQYVNVMMFSLYQDTSYVAELRAMVEASGLPSFEFPNVNKDTPYGQHPGKHVVWFAAPINLDHGSRTRSLTNQASCGGPLDYSMRKTSCARPFREMAIRFDGRTILCCQDWTGVYNAGDLMAVRDIEDIWQGEPLAVARRVLLTNKRVLPPCLGCSSITFRHGLLPNNGEARLPKKLRAATSSDLDTWKDVISEPPLSHDFRVPIAKIGSFL